MAALVPLLLHFAQLAIVAFAAPVANHTLEVRQSVSTLTAAQVAGYKPYSWYAAAAYCPPTRTLAWNCGSESMVFSSGSLHLRSSTYLASCSSNPRFVPIASGGDGALVQYWYVGYDPGLSVRWAIPDVF